MGACLFIVCLSVEDGLTGDAFAELEGAERQGHQRLLYFLAAAHTQKNQADMVMAPANTARSGGHRVPLGH